MRFSVLAGTVLALSVLGAVMVGMGESAAKRERLAMAIADMRASGFLPAEGHGIPKEGGAYLLLSQAGAERSLAVEPDVLAEAEAALRGAEDETDPSEGLAGLSTAYCVLLSEPGLSDPESSAGELLSSDAERWLPLAGRRRCAACGPSAQAACGRRCHRHHHHHQ